MKGEVPAARAEGYANADFGNFDLWFPKSSTDPAEASGYRLSMPPLKGEVPAKQVDGFAQLLWGTPPEFSENEES